MKKTTINNVNNNSEPVLLESHEVGFLDRMMAIALGVFFGIVFAVIFFELIGII